MRSITLLYASLITGVVMLILNLAGDKENSAALFSASVVLFALSYATSIAAEKRIKVQVGDLFSQTNFQINEMKTLLADDEELTAAARFCCQLSSEDLLRFGRLVTELRDNHNQDWLKEISRQFRREK